MQTIEPKNMIAAPLSVTFIKSSNTPKVHKIHPDHKVIADKIQIVILNIKLPMKKIPSIKINLRLYISRKRKNPVVYHGYEGWFYVAGLSADELF
jgi:hypothetical protein